MEAHFSPKKKIYRPAMAQSPTEEVRIQHGCLEMGYTFNVLLHNQSIKQKKRTKDFSNPKVCN
jgi:hypothetical protein